MKKYSAFALGFVAILLILSFLIAGKKVNPPVEAQVAWNTPLTKELFYQSCADCHSNETKWPWYTNFAPVSWIVIDHVNTGREKFNISIANMGEASEAAEEVQKGEMPLWDYSLMHPEAKLSPEKRNQLIQGLIATFGGESENESDE